jgi:hypothetical protein
MQWLRGDYAKFRYREFRMPSALSNQYWYGKTRVVPFGMRLIRSAHTNEPRRLAMHIDT